MAFAFEPGFHPCCNGSCPKSVLENVQELQFVKVSTLVVMEAVLKEYFVILAADNCT